jgi:F0F1-type ATP synthase assembly protein I
MLRERRSIDPDIKNSWRIAGMAGSVGIEIAVAVAIGYFGGTYLDHKLGTRPWLTIFGLVIGVGAAIKALVRVTRTYRRAFEDEDRPADKPRDVTDYGGDDDGRPPSH